MPTVVHVVPHTHWDREWYEPFESYRYRLIGVVDQLLDVIEGDEGFRHFNFDGQTAAIEDYLEIRPDARARVARAVSDGRIAVGPWRILMDEFLCSPETIVRNIQQGTRAARALGRSMRLGYIPDSFGHVSQMPQILRLAGLSEATVWRGVPRAVDRTVFRWVAPDGSEVRAAYLVTSYSNAASLPEDAESLIERARRIARDLEPFAPGDVLLAMNGTDHRAPQAHLPELFAKANAMQDEFEFRIGSMEEYLAVAPREELPVWRGEMRSSARANLLMGVCSARMPLKQAEFAASSLLERTAEPLAALVWMDSGQLLERAWRWMVENSAHDSICGCGIDEVASQVRARYDQATRIAQLLATDSLRVLADSVNTSSLPPGVEGVFVWNPSPRARAGVAEVTFTSPVAPERLAFRSPDGTMCAAQVLETTEQRVVDMKLHGAQLAKITPTIHSRMIGEMHINAVSIEQGRTVHMRLGPVPDTDLDVLDAKARVEAAIARAPNATFRVIGDGPALCRALVATPPVGGLGFTVLEPVAASVETAVRGDGSTIENEHLICSVEPTGSVSVTVRATGARLEGLCAIEDGADAGDEYNYSPPDRDHVVRAPADDVVVEEVARGPVQATLRVTHRYRIPVGLSANGRARSRRTTWLPVVTEYTLRAGEPFLRIALEIRNEATDHRLRALFPLPFTPVCSYADGAFDVVERALTAEGDAHEHGLATFPCRRWVDVSDKETGLAVFHRGTPEYEVTEAGLALTLLRSVGWLSRQGMNYRAGPAGPRLATPGAQLLGTHRFELAVYPHEGDWRAAGVHDVAESFTYPFRASVVRAHPGPLPPHAPWLSIEPSSVQLSALTKEGESVLLRVYNASPGPTDARISLHPTWANLGVGIVDLMGEEIGTPTVQGRTVQMPLRAWEIATLRIGSSAAVVG